MRKMRLQHILLGVIALIAIAGLIYISLGHVAVYLFAKANNLDISYNNLTRSGANFVFKDFRVRNKASSLGISAMSAVIRPKLKGYDFNFTDVRFLKKDGEEESSYENLAGLVAVPFKGSWVYKEIAGEIVPSRDTLEVKKLDAVSDEIKLHITGRFNADNTVDTDIEIYFGPGIIKKIPEELSKIILTDGEAGWKSLTVHLSGNYAQPSIQVSGKLFRLNIKSISEK
ncbi:MAG: hypothetical protein NTW09_05395 [Candidatus Omnitrophica bacterium]|nr:hypothetical protein [Candidatus Omnitrophota bacterium]